MAREGKELISMNNEPGYQSESKPREILGLVPYDSRIQTKSNSDRLQIFFYIEAKC